MTAVSKGAATGVAATTAPTSVAYLGNSMTVQRAGYRPQLHALLQQRWGADLKQVNASLGGVGSLACAGLLDFLVLRHRPDVCLVECSASDMIGATPAGRIGPSIEAITRGLIAVGVTPVFVHLVTVPGVASPARDTTLAQYGRVAHHYGVTVIDLWGRWEPHEGAMLADSIHLTRQGGGDVADHIARHLHLLAAPTPPMPAPLHSDSTVWLASALRAPTMTATEGCMQGRFRLTLPTLEVPVGESVTITPPDGCAVSALLLVADNDAGVVRLSREGFEEQVQIRDRWCDQPRLQALVFDEPVSGPMVATMTDGSRADRACRYEPVDTMTPGHTLRLVGAVMTGSSAPTLDPWWQGDHPCP